MHISSLTIVFMALSAAIAILAPLLALWYFHRQDRLSFKVVLGGAGTFIVFAMILEQLLHRLVIPKISAIPWLYILYGTLAAGVFEECGRYIVLTRFLKGRIEWKDGIAFGLGHGGIEAILLAGLSNIQSIVMAQMINAGKFSEIAQKLPTDTATKILDGFTKTPAPLFLVSGLERVLAIMLHVGFTMIVLYGIRERKKIYLLYAILAHALMDLIPALYQTHVITSVFIAEAVVVVMAMASLLLVTKSRSSFTQV